MLKAGFLFAALALLFGAPNVFAAVEGLTLEDEAYLEFKTADTASTTILSAQGGAGLITVHVEDDYVDIFMQKGATLTLDSRDGVNFTVTNLDSNVPNRVSAERNSVWGVEEVPQNWKEVKSCPTPTTSRLYLDTQGGPATLRITISSGPACATENAVALSSPLSILPFLKGGGEGFLTLLTRFFNFLLGLI